MIQMNFSKSKHLENERMLYSNLYGIFLTIYNNILDIYRIGFVNELYSKNIQNSLFDQRKIYLKKYFESIQKIRNRCAHSNHIINKKMSEKIGKIYLDHFDDNCKKFNKFERSLYFMYKKSENGESFKKDMIKCLKKYRKYLFYCIQKDIIKPNIIERIQENWTK